MLRTWVLGLIVLAVTGYLVNRSMRVSDEDPNELVAALAADTDPELDQELEGLTAPVDLSADPSSAEGAESDPVRERVGLPSAESAEIPEEHVFTESVSEEVPLDVDGPISFRKPGGGLVENKEEARREAVSLIRRAEEAESPIKVASLLTRALRTGGLKQDEWEGIYSSILDVNKAGLMNPENREGCYAVEVGSGDSLWKICQSIVADGHSPVAPGMIRLLNGFSGNSIYLGQKLKVPVEPVWMLVEKGHYRLSVMVGEVLIRRYHVGLGKDGSPTPEGTFHISTLQREPSWFQPGRGEIPFGDEDNVLGTRWLGFKERPSFGVHGTWEPESIGGNFSNGCIRMRNEEVEELFEWIPRGTRIEIHP